MNATELKVLQRAKEGSVVSWNLNEFRKMAEDYPKAFFEDVFRSGVVLEDDMTLLIERPIYEVLCNRYPKKSKVEARHISGMLTYPYTWEDVVVWVSELPGDSISEKWVKGMVAQQQANLKRQCTHCQRSHAEKKICYYWSEYQRLLNETKNKV